MIHNISPVAADVRTNLVLIQYDVSSGDCLITGDMKPHNHFICVRVERRLVMLVVRRMLLRRLMTPAAGRL